MVPQSIIPEQEYVEAFQSYVYRLACKWTGMKAETERAAIVYDKINRVAETNYRATYLKYLLPLVDAGYAAITPVEISRAMHKVLYNLRLNDVPYNDFMLDRFCGIMLRTADLRGLFAARLPEDYKDLQKLLWTFIQCFRTDAALRYDGAGSKVM